MVILFAELPKLQLHFDPVLDSIYITATCHVRYYIFFRRAFVVPLFSPLFDLVVPFLAVPLHMVHPVTPDTAPLAVVATSPPASPPQIVPPSPLRVILRRRQPHPLRPLHLATTTFQQTLAW